LLALWAFVIIFQYGMFPAVIRIAVNGVEVAHPLSSRRMPVGLELIEAEREFFAVAHIEMACAMIALVAASSNAFDRLWESRHARLFVTLVWALAIAALCCETWIRQVGFPRISPAFAEVWPIVPQLAVLLIGLIPVVYIAARASLDGTDLHPAQWRAHPQAYLHERRFILAIAFVVAATQVAHNVLSITAYQGMFGSPLQPFSVLYDFLSNPEYDWTLAMMILAAQRFLAARKNSMDQFVTYGLSRRRFVGNSLLLVVAGIPLTYAMSAWSIAAWLPFGW
jgi:hypothetical protein